MLCFPIGGMENQQHDFLESFGTTEEIKFLALVYR